MQCVAKSGDFQNNEILNYALFAVVKYIPRNIVNSLI